MTTKNIIIMIVVALIAGGAGYSIKSPDSANDKKLQDSITMMKEQSTSIKQMGEMMKTSGLSIEDMGTRYKDEALVASGKDLQAVGEKYLSENKSKSEEGDMKQAMTQ